MVGERGEGGKMREAEFRLQGGGGFRYAGRHHGGAVHAGADLADVERVYSVLGDGFAHRVD
jgi:hypothetical protein